jgi:hypothetical protein
VCGSLQESAFSFLCAGFCFLLSFFSFRWAEFCGDGYHKSDTPNQAPTKILFCNLSRKLRILKGEIEIPSKLAGEGHEKRNLQRTV